MSNFAFKQFWEILKDFQLYTKTVIKIYKEV